MHKRSKYLSRKVKRHLARSELLADISQAILLVGGFGANKYLYQRLKDAHQSEGIEVLQVNGAWSSICRGATLWGLDYCRRASDSWPRIISSRIARYSYGVCWDVPFNASEHHAEDQVIGVDGIVRAKHQMEWVIQKGDKIEENQVIPMDISQCIVGVGLRTALQFKDITFEQQLYYCAANDPPLRKEIDVKRLCSVKCTLPHWTLIKEKKETGLQNIKFRRPNFELLILPGSATIDFTVLYKGVKVAHTEAEYNESS